MLTIQLEFKEDREKLLFEKEHNLNTKPLQIDLLVIRKAEDITVSMIRDGRPEKLFRYFEGHGIRTENPCPGIYYVLDKVLFPTQIIVAKELDRKHHTWLRSLTDKLEEKDMRRLLMDTSRLKGKQDKEFADSVLEVCFRANRQIIEKLKGDDTKSEALLEIMEPLIEPIIAEQKRMIEIQLRNNTIYQRKT